MTIGYVGAAGTCWPTSKEAYGSIYADQGYQYWSNGTTMYQAFKLYFPTANQLFEAVNSMTPPATTWTVIRNSTLTLPQQASCTLETAPGYPQQLTTAGGGSSGPVTGTVTIAPYDITYDYAAASAAFMTGLSLVLMFWLAAKPLGTLLKAIKTW